MNSFADENDIDDDFSADIAEAIDLMETDTRDEYDIPKAAEGHSQTNGSCNQPNHESHEENDAQDSPDTLVSRMVDAQ